MNDDSSDPGSTLTNWAARQQVWDAKAAELAPQDRYNDYTQYWLTADDRAERGYRREFLQELFGTATPLPDGRLVWSVASVDKIENTVIGPALELVDNAFTTPDEADTALARFQFGRSLPFQWPLNQTGEDAIEAAVRGEGLHETGPESCGN
ncbi:hypothetical protein ACFYTQ_33285 [Nocardia sp. NPDC004068]|uniref:hypothetical protein n=1 Tax=Nocardia sp. NPDC004068 TaxID=3364303 RepID=UPI0036C6CAFC